MPVADAMEPVPGEPCDCLRRVFGPPCDEEAWPDEDGVLVNVYGNMGSSGTG